MSEYAKKVLDLQRKIDEEWKIVEIEQGYIRGICLEYENHVELNLISGDDIGERIKKAEEAKLDFEKEVLVFVHRLSRVLKRRSDVIGKLVDLEESEEEYAKHM